MAEKRVGRGMQQRTAAFSDFLGRLGIARARDTREVQRTKGNVHARGQSGFACPLANFFCLPHNDRQVDHACTQAGGEFRGIPIRVGCGGCDE